VTANFATVVTFLSEADSYVDWNAHNNNYGTDTTMEVRSTTSGSPDRNRRSFVQFDVSSIPATATILSANLRLYLVTEAPSASRSYDAHRVTSPAWVESTITWNNQPAVTGSPTSTISVTTPLDRWLSWDVASDVAAFVASTFTNYGWRISDSVESSATDYRSYFDTREYTGTTYDPQLVVTYLP
jgi:hypothetical protein